MGTQPKYQGNSAFLLERAAASAGRCTRPLPNSGSSALGQRARRLLNANAAVALQESSFETAPRHDEARFECILLACVGTLPVPLFVSKAVPRLRKAEMHSFVSGTNECRSP